MVFLRETAFQLLLFNYKKHFEELKYQNSLYRLHNSLIFKIKSKLPPKIRRVLTKLKNILCGLFGDH